MALKLVFLILALSNINAESVTCNGDCECSDSGSGKCKLKCKTKDICKDSTLTCRDGEKCEIHCDGDNSCEGNTVIDGSGATDVTVYCDGDDSCKGNTLILCGSGECSISCGSSSSCTDLRVEANDATMVSCDGSCGESDISPFIAPTKSPSPSPTSKPTKSPTVSSAPTVRPTVSPTTSPSDSPSIEPTSVPTSSPSVKPSVEPTLYPTASPTMTPTEEPTESPSVSNRYTDDAFYIETLSPSAAPSVAPSVVLSPGTDPESTEEPIATTSGDSDLETVDEEQFVVQGVESNLVSNTGSDATTFYVFIACGVLITFGAVICCFGIFVHFSTKRNHLKYHNRTVLPHHGPPAPVPPALVNVRTMSGDSVVVARDRMAAQYPIPKVPSPEPDGYTMDIFTAPTGSLNPILQQEHVDDVEVEQNVDPELDNIVSPRQSVPPNVNVNMDGDESIASVPESQGDENWDLTSCSSSTDHVRDGDDIQTADTVSDASSAGDEVYGNGETLNGVQITGIESL